MPKDTFNYDAYEGYAGPDITDPPPKLPFTRDEADILLKLVRSAHDRRAALSAMRGGKEMNQLTKDLRYIEQEIVRSLVFGRGYLGYNWPEHRIAVRIRGQVLKERSVRGMGLLIFND